MKGSSLVVCGKDETRKGEIRKKMLARVITLRFNSMLESFDDEPLRDFIKDKEVFSIRDHFFTRNDTPYLALVIAYSMPPQLVPERNGAEKKRDESWRESVPEKDVPLFNTLRDWRNELGKRGGLPPYMIFTNRQLASIVATRPESLTKLTEIEGIGKVKADKYGKDVLKIVAQPSETESAEPEKKEPSEK